MKYRIHYNIGKVRYAVSFHDGVKTHNDGSPFFDLKTFTNKRTLAAFIAELRSRGFKLI